MPIISQDNIYIAKSLIKASIKPYLLLTVLQLKTDSDTDPRTTCSCCSSAYQVERTIHIFEGRYYRFTYYNEGISYDKMIGEVTHIECDPNYPDSGYVEVKAYVDEADIERKVYANIKRIPIANIQDAVDITPYDSPIDKGDDYKLMILGISAQKVRALVINLKMINDNELDQAVKEVSLIVGNKYKVCYNSKENELDCFKGTLTGMLEIPNLDQAFATGYNPNCGFVREDGECKYPEYNKYYLGEGCSCDGCPIAGNCHTEEEISFYNNTYDKDRFLRLPENMVSDVLLTFDVTTDEDTSTVYKKIYLSQIRDVCDMYHYEDPASTDLEVEAVNSTLFIYAKNSRIVAIKTGEYESWDEADVKPVDVHAIYPNSYIPTLVNMYADGKYTVLSEFVDDTRAVKGIDFVRVETTETDKINDFVTRLNSWAIGHFVHAGDNTKPLIEAAFDEEEDTIHINFNYYNTNKYSNAPELLKILDPKEIDSFLINVVQKSINTEDIIINDLPIYEDGVLSLDYLYSYIKSIIVRLQDDCEDRVSIGEDSYLLHEDDLTIISNFKIDYEVTFPTQDDEDDFDAKLTAIKNFVTFSTVEDGSDVGFDKFKDKEVLMINFHTGTNLGNYLDNINNDRRAAINHFTVGSFLDIFKSLDVLAGNQYASTYNDLLKITQRNNRFICHVLCNLKDTKVYKSDGTPTTIVDPCKIFDMEAIDSSYVTYDPQGFYKLTSAFKNLFTDLLDTTNMVNFYYPELETYNGYCLFNVMGTWNIGHIGSIDIPVCINYAI